MSRKRKNFDKAIAMYEGGKSLEQIAEIFNVTRQSMWVALKRRGVKFRAQKRFGKEHEHG